MEQDSYDGEEIQGGSRVLPALVVVNLVLTVLIGGFVGYTFITQSKAETSLAGATAAAADAVVPPEPVGTYSFEPFIVNLMDAANIRYVKVVMQVELSNAQVIEEIELRTPQIRDMVNTLLSNRTYGELLGVHGKTQLREELLRRMNQALSSGTVTRIYFTEFVVQ